MVITMIIRHTSSCGDTRVPQRTVETLDEPSARLRPASRRQIGAALRKSRAWMKGDAENVELASRTRSESSASSFLLRTRHHFGAGPALDHLPVLRSAR